MSGPPVSSSVSQYSVRGGGINPQQPSQFKSSTPSVTPTWQTPPGPSSRPQGPALPMYRPLLYQPFSTVPPRPHGYTYPIAPPTNPYSQGQQKVLKDASGTLSPYSNPYAMPGWHSAQAWAKKKFSPTPPPGSAGPNQAPTPVARTTYASPAPSSLGSGPKPSPGPQTSVGPPGGSGSGRGSEDSNALSLPPDLPNLIARPPPVPHHITIAQPASTPATAPPAPPPT